MDSHSEIECDASSAASAHPDDQHPQGNDYVEEEHESLAVIAGTLEEQQRRSYTAQERVDYDFCKDTGRRYKRTLAEGHDVTGKNLVCCPLCYEDLKKRNTDLEIETDEDRCGNLVLENPVDILDRLPNDEVPAMVFTDRRQVVAHLKAPITAGGHGLKQQDLKVGDMKNEDVFEVVGRYDLKKGLIPAWESANPDYSYTTSYDAHQYEEREMFDGHGNVNTDLVRARPTERETDGDSDGSERPKQDAQEGDDALASGRDTFSVQQSSRVSYWHKHDHRNARKFNIFYDAVIDPQRVSFQDILPDRLENSLENWQNCTGYMVEDFIVDGEEDEQSSERSEELPDSEESLGEDELESEGSSDSEVEETGDVSDGFPSVVTPLACYHGAGAHKWTVGVNENGMLVAKLEDVEHPISFGNGGYTFMMRDLETPDGGSQNVTFRASALENNFQEGKSPPEQLAWVADDETLIPDPIAWCIVKNTSNCQQEEEEVDENVVFTESEADQEQESDLAEFLDDESEEDERRKHRKKKKKRRTVSKKEKDQQRLRDLLDHCNDPLPAEESSSEEDVPQSARKRKHAVLESSEDEQQNNEQEDSDFSFSEEPEQKTKKRKLRKSRD
eukprot:gene300-48_t